MAGNVLVNLFVPGHRLFLAGGRVDVNIVPAAVAQKTAAGLLQLADQVGPFHTASSFTWWSSGTSSRTIIR